MTNLKLYNSKTKEKTNLLPIEKNVVRLYVCGITVYDDCHIGHARTFLVFDMLVRYLRSQGYTVIYVRNITDIDDKIIQRAAENNESTTELTDRYIARMHEDMRILNLCPPDHEPRASEYIADMVAMIEKLESTGFAYVGTNGDVFYKVRKFDNYGSLSNRRLADMQVGARVEKNTAKSDPLDFVLWKQAADGEPAWPSPWGQGRPGWHIECSAMSTKLLGDTLDIHGGGHDLLFPHHENECAQSEAVTGKTFVNHWLHVGFLQVEKTKMSKSLGNFSTIRQVLASYHPEVVRYFMLSAHYRQPLEYSQAQLQLSHQAVVRLYMVFRDQDIELENNNLDNLDKLDKNASEHVQNFIQAMDDDLNTPAALSILFKLVKIINNKKNNKNKSIPELLILKKLARCLGLLYAPVEQFFQATEKTEEIEQLIAAREQARLNKQWQQADDLRKQLTEMGVILEDTANGTLWRTKNILE